MAGLFRLLRVILCLNRKASALLGAQAGLPSGGGLGGSLVRRLNGSKGVRALAQERGALGRIFFGGVDMRLR